MSDAQSRIQSTRERVLADGVFLCVRLGPGAPVVELCRAAASGGLHLLEITLTTPGALDAIRELSDEGLLVGGGTVLSPHDARAVADAGGCFALSPVFDPDVVDEAHRLGLLAVPGASTPKEILAAHRYGADLVKVFPAGPLGGPDYVRAVRGPLPDVPLVPTSARRIPPAQNCASKYVATTAPVPPHSVGSSAPDSSEATLILMILMAATIESNGL